MKCFTDLFSHQLELEAHNCDFPSSNQFKQFITPIRRLAMLCCMERPSKLTDKYNDWDVLEDRDVHDIDITSSFHLHVLGELPALPPEVRDEINKKKRDPRAHYHRRKRMN